MSHRHPFLTCSNVVMLEVYLIANNAVKTFKHDRSDVPAESLDEICSICLEKIRDCFADNGKTVCDCANIPVQTKCGHWYHLPCILQSLVDGKNKNCPMCNTQLVQ